MSGVIHNWSCLFTVTAVLGEVSSLAAYSIYPFKQTFVLILLECHKGCLNDPPSHAGSLAYPYCEKDKEPSCKVQLAFDHCSETQCHSPYHKAFNLTMGQRPLLVIVRAFYFFFIHMNNGSWIDAVVRCSGWGEDEAGVTHLKDKDDIYQVFMRRLTRCY